MIVISFVDKVLDCVPVLSTIKNAGVLKYQTAHKVNEVANPVKYSLKNELKIYYLSKEEELCKLSLIPVLGNLVAFVSHIIDLVTGLKSPLIKATRSQFKHRFEVASLYLTSHPNVSKKEMKEAFENAICDPKMLKLILQSKKDWDSEVIAHALKIPQKDLNVTKLLLEKADNLTAKEKEDVLFRVVSSQKNFEIIKLLIGSFKDLKIKAVARITSNCIYNEHALSIVDEVLNGFSHFNPEVLVLKACLEAARNPEKNEIVFKIFEKVPQIKSNGILLIEAARRKNFELFNAMYSKFPINDAPKLMAFLERILLTLGEILK